MKDQNQQKAIVSRLRAEFHRIIFGYSTPAGKGFDIILLVAILLSVAVVLLESVEEIDARFHRLFFVVEWTLTILFTLEYGLRIFSIRKPLKYIFSFYGVVDLLAILPTYLSLIFAGSQYLGTIRALRLLRIFRILKLARYLSQSRLLIGALKASRPKIVVFLLAVGAIVIIIGSVMYLVEGNEDSGFTSIPKSIYWAVVTLTTVGYGDIAPSTVLGQFLASVLMITGYAIIAVPSGIISLELAQIQNKVKNEKSCKDCGAEHLAPQSKFCNRCGSSLGKD